MCPNLSSLPQLIITRWGTLLNAAFYNSKNFNKVKEVINTFNENDVMSIQKVQDVFKDNSIKNEFAVILSKF